MEDLSPRRFRELPPLSPQEKSRSPLRKLFLDLENVADEIDGMEMLRNRFKGLESPWLDATFDNDDREIELRECFHENKIWQTSRQHKFDSSPPSALQKRVVKLESELQASRRALLVLTREKEDAEQLARDLKSLIKMERDQTETELRACERDATRLKSVIMVATNAVRRAVELRNDERRSDRHDDEPPLNALYEQVQEMSKESSDCISRLRECHQREALALEQLAEVRRELEVLRSVNMDLREDLRVNKEVADQYQHMLAECTNFTMLAAPSYEESGINTGPDWMTRGSKGPQMSRSDVVGRWGERGRAAQRAHRAMSIAAANWSRSDSSDGEDEYVNQVCKARQNSKLNTTW